ncbi:DJ-1/PfpI family protein [Desulfogranum japonicum]|uniref:DJ-1/PfpI family protein n=1 Tax=Desulfogranum japonicum TaxID=231447 RepID=UPI000423A708|nr:DJ-1/PfpI family protein [Desulfogranum japonicum]
MHTKKRIAILLFDDVEVLDFTGPFEVFSVTNELADYTLMDIYTVAARKGSITAKNGLTVIPDYEISQAPEPDLLIIPGGDGTRPILQQDRIITWIITTSRKAEKILSVCTGSLVLAQCGLLNGLQATTHHQAFNELQRLAPETEIVTESRFVDNGKILTSGGISAGIDMSLYTIEHFYGKETAARTAAYMEYPYTSSS